MFVDSMPILQADGYKRLGLDALCEELNMKRKSHSALEDAYILKTVYSKKSGMLDHPYGYTFGDYIPLNSEITVANTKGA